MVWIDTYGEIPEGYEIDHIDGDQLNNDISNLRLVTHLQNMLAIKPQKNSLIQYKGVTSYLNCAYVPPSPYIAHLRIPSLNIKNRKCFKTSKEAASQYDEWIKNLPPEILYEHNILGNKNYRVVPYLNFLS